MGVKMDIKGFGRSRKSIWCERIQCQN